MALEKLGGFWLKEKEDGSSFLSGKIKDTRVLIFENTKKEEDRQPDYLAYKVVKDDEDNISSQNVKPEPAKKTFSKINKKSFLRKE